MVGGSSVDDEAHSIPDILKGLEGFVKILDKLGQFVGSRLTDVALIDN